MSFQTCSPEILDLFLSHAVGGNGDRMSLTALIDIGRIGRAFSLARDIDQILSERKFRKLLKSKGWPEDLVRSAMAAWTFFTSNASDRKGILRDLSEADRDMAIANMIRIIDIAFQDDELASAAIKNATVRDTFQRELSRIAPIAESFLRERWATKDGEVLPTETDKAENLGLWLIAATKNPDDDPDGTRVALAKIWAETGKMSLAVKDDRLGAALGSLMVAINNLREGLDLASQGDPNYKGYTESFVAHLSNWERQMRDLKDSR